MTKDDLLKELRVLVRRQQEAKEDAEKFAKLTELRRLAVCQKWTELFNACTPLEFSEIVKAFSDEHSAKTKPCVTGSHV